MVICEGPNCCVNYAAVPSRGIFVRRVGRPRSRPRLPNGPRDPQHYLDLQRSLIDLEDHIQNARRYYNAVVRDYNIRIAQFPSNLVAGAFRFGPREFFGIEDAAERAVPVVNTR